MPILIVTSDGNAYTCIGVRLMSFSDKSVKLQIQTSTGFETIETVEARESEEKLELLKQKRDDIIKALGKPAFDFRQQ